MFEHWKDYYARTQPYTAQEVTAWEAVTEGLTSSETDALASVKTQYANTGGDVWTPVELARLTFYRWMVSTKRMS